MSINAMQKIAATVIGIGLLLTGCASPKTQEDARTTVTEAEATLARFQSDPDMKWLHAHIKDAKAIMISPKILEAGFIVGGSGGPAVVIARSKTTQGWTSPAFYKLSTGSLGLQAGAQSSEVVALIMTDKALNSLMSSEFKLGGDVSVAAGPVGAGAASGLTQTWLSFPGQRDCTGASILRNRGLSINDTANESFYGRPACPVDILVKHSVSSPVRQ